MDANNKNLALYVATSEEIAEDLMRGNEDASFIKGYKFALQELKTTFPKLEEIIKQLSKEDKSQFIINAMLMEVDDEH